MHINVENFGNSSSKFDPHEHNEGGQVCSAGRSPATLTTATTQMQERTAFSDLRPLEVQVAARASPLHRFPLRLRRLLNLSGQPERIGWRSSTEGCYVLRLPLRKTALGPKSGSDSIRRPLPAISDRCQSSSVRFARRPDLQELP